METKELTLTRSPYDVLGVTRWSDKENVKASYYRLVKQYNPEYYPEKFIEIRTAFDILQDDQRRAETDVAEFAPAPPYESADYPDLDPQSISMFKLNQEWKTLFGDRPLKELGDHEKDRALQLLRGMALHHALHERTEEAEHIWSEIVEIDPEDRESKTNRLYAIWAGGYFKAQESHFDEAEQLFQRLLDEGGRHGAIYQNLALAREKQGKKEEAYQAWSEALADYKKDLKENPEDPYCKALVIALHKYTGGRFLEGESVEGGGESIHSGSSKELGFACIRQGNWKQALEALQQALKENPEDVDVICQLGWALLNTNQHVKAFNQWNHALKLAPGKQSVVDHLVKGYTVFGKRLKDQRIYNQALVQFKNALKHEPDSIEIRLLLADTYMNMQNYSAAVREYEKVLEKEARHKEARQGMREAKRLGGIR